MHLHFSLGCLSKAWTMQHIPFRLFSFLRLTKQVGVEDAGEIKRKMYSTSLLSNLQAKDLSHTWWSIPAVFATLKVFSYLTVTLEFRWHSSNYPDLISEYPELNCVGSICWCITVVDSVNAELNSDYPRSWILSVRNQVLITRNGILSARNWLVS